MSKISWASLCILAVLTLAATGAEAAVSPQVVNSFKDWTLYRYDDKGGKVCYIASEPKKQTGSYKKRGAAAFLVARLPGNKPSDQVSVQPGYSYKDGSDVKLMIDKSPFSMFTRGEYGWASSSDDDNRIIAAMRKGSSMTVRGTSTLGSYSLDTYSLSGFAAAYDAMVDACKS